MRKDGELVGRIYAYTFTVDEFWESPTTPRDLHLHAQNFIEEFREDRTSAEPGSTFESIGPDNIAIGDGHGVRFGWTWTVGTYVERIVIYAANIDGGVAWFKASTERAEDGDEPGGFENAEYLARFLPRLDQIVGALRLPVIG